MKLRRFLLLVGGIGLSIVVATSLGNPAKVEAAFDQVRWYVFPLIFFIQLGSYYCNAKYYQAFFKISGYAPDLRRLYETALGINFANQAIPSGGVAGTTYLVQALKPYGVPTGTATLAQLGRYTFTFISFFGVLSIGFVLLFLGGNLGRISVRLIVLLMILVLGAGVLLLTTFSDRKRLETIARPIIKIVNRIGKKVFHRKHMIVTPQKVDSFMDEFYDGYRDIMGHKGKWPSLLRWTFLANIAEVSTVYSVFVGFGIWPNPGVVIAGYTLAIMASISGIIINGLGVYEAGMIGTFVALGTPFALTFAIVTVYRITSMAIFLPIGWHFYRIHLKDS